MKRIMSFLLISLSFLSCKHEKASRKFDPLDYMTDPPVLLDKRTGIYYLRDDSSFLNEYGMLRKDADTLLFSRFCERWDVDPLQYINSETGE